MTINFEFKIDESVFKDERISIIADDFKDWSKDDLVEYASFLLYIASTK